ncbi:hypothetical protein SEA_MACGULLY_91 [Rhodococcus phage MacGully]|nr:hypothetical protein SEA_MACGULLY_91 [Rhodococcus phage MacGully]
MSVRCHASTVYQPVRTCQPVHLSMSVAVGPIGTGGLAKLRGGAGFADRCWGFGSPLRARVAVSLRLLALCGGPRY